MYVTLAFSHDHHIIGVADNFYGPCAQLFKSIVINSSLLPAQISRSTLNKTADTTCCLWRSHGILDSVLLISPFLAKFGVIQLTRYFHFANQTITNTKFQKQVEWRERERKWYYREIWLLISRSEHEIAFSESAGIPNVSDWPTAGLSRLNSIIDL